MTEELKQAIADELQVDASELTPETEMADYDNWDSVTGLMLSVLINDATGVNLSGAELLRCRTFGDVISLIEKNAR